MSELALFGGKPVLDAPIPPYPAMGEAEKRAVVQVIESGQLSGFYGSPGEEFWGGPRVRALEAAWRERYDVAHAISVNSATSGLYAAMGAIGLSPGDQVIVPPWTMSATAMAPLVYGGVPVFADIEDETFGLDPAAVEAVLTSRTRAIIAVNLFGHPARLDALRAIADAHGLYLVEDNAQAPLAEDNGRLAGTIGHIGVFSLNRHKHIHAGEGGMCVTADDRLARRLALIRNHGENVADWLGEDDLVNLVGFNYRMTELSAAVAVVQLENVDAHVTARERFAHGLSVGVRSLAGLTPPHVRHGCRHNYYCWVVRFDEAAVGVARDRFRDALTAEGVPCSTGYAAPLYGLPLFQRRTAIGREGFPFTRGAPDYGAASCPVTERLHLREALLIEPCAIDPSGNVSARIIEAFHKVHRHAGELAASNRTGAAA